MDLVSHILSKNKKLLSRAGVNSIIMIKSGF